MTTLKQQTITDTNPAFEKLFNDATTSEIVFNPLWANGTSYFDKAVLNNSESSVAPNIPAGEVRKCVSSNNRPMLLIGTQKHGNIVLFRRFSLGDVCQVVVVNMNYKLKIIIAPLPGEGLDGAMTEAKIDHLLTAVALLDLIAS